MAQHLTMQLRIRNISRLEARLTVGLMLILSSCVGPILTPTPPYTIRYYGTRTSGNLTYSVGTFASGVCHMYCGYQLSTILPSGYEQAQIFLTGWRVENLGGTTTLQRIRLSTTAVHYDSASGKFDWEASADLRSNVGFGDEYRFTVYFSILLAKSAGARMTVFSDGCSAPTGGRCQQSTQIPNAIPAGWEPNAVAVRMFEMEVVSATVSGIPLNRLALNINQWNESGTTVDVPLECEMFDGTPTEPMKCKIEGVSIAMAPGETFHTRFGSGHTLTQFLASPTQSSPPSLPVDGALGGLDRFLLSYGSGQEAKTWSLAADYMDTVICPNNIDFCYDRIGFLGDTFRSQTNTHKFDMEITGFAIWTRPP
jgi:hypothetical protein